MRCYCAPYCVPLNDSRLIGLEGMDWARAETAAAAARGWNVEDAYAVLDEEGRLTGVGGWGCEHFGEADEDEA